MFDIKEKVRLIAFYLPQFHSIPENDKWWGAGFTEWTNVKKARPLFPGHYQPRIPADLGFYNLRVPEVRDAQAALAAQYGIYGFCYYHYWFNGKRVLERPFTEVLSSGKPDFPFCLCWANENWTRTWCGGNNNILLKQEYSEEDDLAHIRTLIPALKDRRYIRINGKPLLLIYRVELLPNPAKTAEIWRNEAISSGVGDIYLAKVEGFKSGQDPKSIGLDAAVEFAPHWRNMEAWKYKLTNYTKIIRKLGMLPKAYEENFVSRYDFLIDYMLKDSKRGYKRFRCVTPSFDNSPRRSKNAVIFTGSTPKKYENWLKDVLQWTVREYKDDERIVFINAWNEWGEGNYLEPDLKWGKAYREATIRALDTILNIPTLNVTTDEDASIEPLISIVILTKNGGMLLQNAIKMLFSQQVEFPYEVIIIDSGSRDGTLEFLRNYPIRLFEINPKDFSFGPTRDFGFSKARGKYVVTISQDAVPTDEKWLQKLVDPLLKNEADAVQGQTCARIDRKIFFWERKGYFYFTSEAREFHRAHGNIDFSCTNLAIKKDIWEKIRFGDIPMGEDKMLQKRLFSLGYRMVKKKDALAYHGHTYNLLTLIKRCENEGMGWRRVGVRYSFSQMLTDLRQEKWIYGMLLKKIIKREVTSLAEIFFLIVRPIFLYKGNLINKRFKF